MLHYSFPSLPTFSLIKNILLVNEVVKQFSFYNSSIRHYFLLICIFWLDFWLLTNKNKSFFPFVGKFSFCYKRLMRKLPLGPQLITASIILLIMWKIIADASNCDQKSCPVLPTEKHWKKPKNIVSYLNILDEAKNSSS